MIQDRVRGVGNLTTACQCVLTLFTFWTWFFAYSSIVPSGEGINLRSYAGYSLLIVLGLVIEFLLRNRATSYFPVQQPSIIPQIPGALRQTAVAVGFLLF